MSTYYPKGVVNRYWKRPKPRVYECNIRDAERFYQQSYKDYQEAKEYAAKKASEKERSSMLGHDSSSRWGVRRANSHFDPTLDSVSRTSSGYDSKSSYINATSSSGQYGDDAFSGGSSYRSVGNVRSSEESDMTSYEDRLKRLQKLRADLGLPSENAGGSSGASKVTFASSTSSNRGYSPSPRERRGKTIDVGSDLSFTATRSSNRARAMELTTQDSYDDKLPSGNERSSRFASKYSKDDDSFENKYRPSSLKSDRKYELNDSPLTNGDVKTYKSSRKPINLDDDEECDADAYLSNIKKKFPTSDEILERIKKMDSDL